jgi:hypothetical protein
MLKLKRENEERKRQREEENKYLTQEQIQERNQQEKKKIEERKKIIEEQKKIQQQIQQQIQENYIPTPEFETLLDEFNSLVSKSSCTINLIHLYDKELRKIHQRADYDFLANYIKSKFDIISNNENYWNWYFDNYGRIRDRILIANSLRIKPTDFSGYKTTPEYGVYFILISFYCIKKYYMKNNLQQPITDPFWIMFIISIVNLLTVSGHVIRKVISIFADICKKYGSDIHFEYVCDKRGKDIEYTCGRYLVYNKSTKSIEIMQTTSYADDNVLFGNVEELKKNNNIAEFTINCYHDSEEIDSEELDSKEMNSKEMNSKEMNSKEMNSKVSDNKQLDSEEMNSKVTDGKQLDSEEMVFYKKYIKYKNKYIELSKKIQKYNNTKIQK